MDQADIRPQEDARKREGAAEAPRGGTSLRELIDELVLVFVLVMFLKMFIVEHYKIPSGSMTPTLLGGQVAYLNFVDGKKGLAYWTNINEAPLVYVKRDGRYLLEKNMQINTDELLREHRVHEEFDHVLVNRLSYWFHPPRRGDIVVFKVPAEIFKPDSPVYIKRLVGEPGDTLSFVDDGRLVANGKLVTKPDFFQTQHYLTHFSNDDNPRGHIQELLMETKSPGGALGYGSWEIDKIHVPLDQALVFGDNSTPRGSWDSRYWGGVPLDNFKGRAFLRVWPVWPLSQLGFLH